MSEVYAVPTRGRWATVGSKTLTALRNAGVPPGRIELWVDEDEADTYTRAVPPDLYGEIRVGPPGTNLRDKRNHLVRQYPTGTRLVQCDDDVTAYWYAFTRKRPLHRLTDLPELVDWAYQSCDRLGFGLWGLYPIDNPYFMRPHATTDLRYIAGPTWGITVTGDDTELVSLDDKEDFERSVKFAIRDGGVLRINWAAYSTMYYGEPGGMQTYRTEESVTEGAYRLAAMHPAHVTLRPQNKRGTTEVRLTRGQPVASPIPAPARWGATLAAL